MKSKLLLSVFALLVGFSAQAQTVSVLGFYFCEQNGTKYFLERWAEWDGLSHQENGQKIEHNFDFDFDATSHLPFIKMLDGHPVHIPCVRANLNK